jgi:hypothetical protein
MSEQVSFSLPMRGRNPDVLTCIANLSNDEVFTPPEFANRMLDTLADAWAANNGGADLWADSSVRFLDPCTKSGVFLREITSRLNKGLAAQIPHLQKRVDHILSKQVFGNNSFRFNFSGFLVSHSHNVSTIQPSFRSCLQFRLSLAAFDNRFVCQNSGFVAGTTRP